MSRRVEGRPLKRILPKTRRHTYLRVRVCMTRDFRKFPKKKPYVFDLRKDAEDGTRASLKYKNNSNASMNFVFKPKTNL